MEASRFLKSYINNKSIASEQSGRTYRARLSRFGFYLFKTREESMDGIINQMVKGKLEPYELLTNYASYLKKNGFKSNEMREKIKTAKRFLRFCRVPINSEDFREFVSLPKKQKPEFHAVEKSEIVELLNNCKNLRLKTALLLFASTGCRAIEGCAVKLSDVDFDRGTITFPKEYTKTGAERTRLMTKEFMTQLKIWLTFKYRKRRIVSKVGDSWKTRYVEPERDENDLVLAFYRGEEKKATPEGLYDGIYDEYQQMTNLYGMKRKNGKRIITFHRLRAFVKSTISDLGYQDFSEWYIGHSGSTYYQKSAKELSELCRKIEPYLTFLDVTSLEATHADLQSEIEELRTQLAEQDTTIERLVDEKLAAAGFSKFQKLGGNFGTLKPTGESDEDFKD